MTLADIPEGLPRPQEAWSKVKIYAKAHCKLLEICLSIWRNWCFGLSFQFDLFLPHLYEIWSELILPLKWLENRIKKTYQYTYLASCSWASHDSSVSPQQVLDFIWSAHSTNFNELNLHGSITCNSVILLSFHPSWICLGNSIH